jgi:hypothetical protein
MPFSVFNIPNAIFAKIIRESEFERDLNLMVFEVCSKFLDSGPVPGSGSGTGLSSGFSRNFLGEEFKFLNLVDQRVVIPCRALEGIREV